MLGGDHDVFHSGILSHLYPCIRIIFGGIKLFRVSLVLGYRNFSPVHNPFADPVDFLAIVNSGWDRIDTPVNKHTETSVAPPAHLVISIRLREQDGRKTESDD